MKLTKIKLFIYVALYVIITQSSLGEMDWNRIVCYRQKNSSNIQNFACKITSVSELDNQYMENRIRKMKEEEPGFVPILLTKDSKFTRRYQNETYVYEKGGRIRHDFEYGTLDEEGDVIETSRDISKRIWDDKKIISYQKSSKGSFAVISKDSKNSLMENSIDNILGVDFFERVERWTNNKEKNDDVTVNLDIKEGENDIMATLESNGQKYQAFLDRNKGYSLVRQNRYVNNTLMASKEYHYQMIDGIWLPSKLTIIKYSGGTPVISKNITYSDIEINKKLDNSLFEFELPTGTRVEDLIANTRYEVGNPESTHTISSQPRSDKPYEDVDDKTKKCSKKRNKKTEKN